MSDVVVSCQSVITGVVVSSQELYPHPQLTCCSILTGVEMLSERPMHCHFNSIPYSLHSHNGLVGTNRKGRTEGQSFGENTLALCQQPCHDATSVLIGGLIGHQHRLCSLLPRAGGRERSCGGTSAPAACRAGRASVPSSPQCPDDAEGTPTVGPRVLCRGCRGSKQFWAGSPKVVGCFWRDFGAN